MFSHTHRLISSLNKLNDLCKINSQESPEILIKPSERVVENDDDIKITMFDAMNQKLDKQSFKFDATEPLDYNLTPRYVANSKPEVISSHRHYATRYHE